jgi:pentatricopeptide repeat protein
MACTLTHTLTLTLTMQVCDWFQCMNSAGFPPVKATFDSAIQVYSHTGFVIGAVRWLTAMVACNILPDDVTFRWAKRACARAASVSEAEWCFGVMVDAGLLPDVGAYTAVINVCAHTGDAAGAVRWFHSMKEAGIWPGVIAYNSVINAHVRWYSHASLAPSRMLSSSHCPHGLSCTALLLLGVDFLMPLPHCRRTPPAYLLRTYRAPHTIITVHAACRHRTSGPSQRRGWG